MIVGTIGHIDHGKTTLVKALTGVDADRLPEEKARGITLDLGYAYLPNTDGSVLGFVDMPGHEGLVHNMLAGATGVDFVLMVVAADDGPMPQTREHLEIIDLLGLSLGAVALSKCDAVDATRVGAARNEIEALLAGTTLEGCPVFPLSAVNGEGVAALRAHLDAAAASQTARSMAGQFRLAIDRCFSLPGLGTAVTGTAHAGQVRVGDTVVVSPAGIKARVRSVHAQDRPAHTGRSGERCALVLAGDFERKDIARGMWLVAPTRHCPITRFHAELRVPAGQPPLRHWSAIHLYLGADDITGRVALLDCEEVGAGSVALAEIILDRETVAVRGDRFVLRDAGAQRNVGGGRVLDGFPPTRHKRSAEHLALLAALRDDDPAVTLGLVLARSPTGVPLERFAANWNLEDEALAEMCRRQHARIVGSGENCLAYSEAGWVSLRTRMLEALTQEHERAPDMLGVERERLRRMTLATLPRLAFDVLAAELLAAGDITQTRAWLHLPGHHASVSSADRELFAVFKPLLEASPWNPPRVRDIYHSTGMPENTVRQLFKRLARAGELYPVAHDHYFTATSVSSLAAMVKELCEQHGAARAADLRDRIGGGRKVAIHILEFFDRIGYTRRVRDSHALRNPSTMPEWLSQ